MSFSGAKLALFIDDALLVIRRDNRPDIPYPNHLDLPGGGREGAESPAQCVLRETREEVGLRLTERQLTWERQYHRPRGAVWFFAARLPAGSEGGIRFGQEGQGWRLMPPRDYVRSPDAVPHLAEQVALLLDAVGLPG